MRYRQLPLIAALLVAANFPAAQAQTTPADTLRLSIEDAVTLGLRVADEVRLSDAQADVAEAQYDVARSAMLPQLRVTSGYTRTFASARSSAVSTVFNQPNTYTVGANLSQTLFQGGRLYSTARAAGGLANASRLNAQEERATFNVAVQRAYMDALLADRIVALQETNLSLAAARLTQVQQFQSAGRAAQYDVLRAKVEHANLLPTLIQARNDRDLAYLQLKQLLNIPVDRPLSLTSTIDPQAANATVASLLDSTVRIDRPALRAAELTAQASHLAITAARADLFPTVTAFVQTGYQAFPPAGTGFPSQHGVLDAQFCPAGSAAGRVCQNGGWFADRSLGFQFSWPVFDGLRARSALEAAHAVSTTADIMLRQERERVAVEVAQAKAELQRARAVFEGLQETSREAQEAFRLASLRFSRGLSTQLEVSDAQLALLTAESAEARGTYDLYLASAELARALGKPIPLPATTGAPQRRTND
jgi:outer membrane protein TolC